MGNDLIRGSFKVEWKDNPDTRLAAMAPVGGRAARGAATVSLPGVRDPTWATSSTRPDDGWLAKQENRQFRAK